MTVIVYSYFAGGCFLLIELERTPQSLLPASGYAALLLARSAMAGKRARSLAGKTGLRAAFDQKHEAERAGDGHGLAVDWKICVW
ncbi:hypothetical protein [Acidovorax sp. CCYZU-2555]|uniref:hypothetical protein n=1 Tax=Acidovorax sp. CCYZU-2555 TaxID=2835042 RepID=UPI001BCB1658|nr:hypothetical protein [Acidovorax sp. CCYZU-2555]MBS7777946.1 hypothetical protein [Acidovorax sp. CCYZU-2555]